MEGGRKIPEEAGWLGSQGKSAGDTEGEQSELMGSAKRSRRKALLLQVMAAIAAGWAQINVGATVSLSGAILPQLTNANTSDLRFDEANAAFFSSSPHMGATAGCLIAGMMIVVLGQRVVMLIVLPIFLASWITIAFSNIIFVVQVMRIIQGASMGVMNVAPNAYVTEFADERYRGTLDGVVLFIRGLGLLLPFSLEAMSMNWRHMTLVCGIVSVIPSFLVLLFFPNSPRWLASAGRFEEAEKALRFFRGQMCDITSEMDDIKIAVDNNKVRPTLKSQFLQLRNWALLKRFLVLSFAIISAEFSGYIVVFSYGLSIFENVTEGFDPSMCTVIMGLFRSFTGVCYILIIDRLNRRKGLLTFLISAVSMACMGVYFYIQIEMDDPDLLASLSFVPLTCVLVHVFFACFGITLVLLMKLETLPLSFRSLGSGIVEAIAFLSIFLVVQTFPYMNKAIKPYGTFWVYAGFCLVTALVPAIFLPETRGKTLEMIELSSRPISSGGKKCKYQGKVDRSDPTKT